MKNWKYRVVNGRKIIEMGITEEDFKLAEEMVMQGVRNAKPSYEKKTTKELLKIFEMQAHAHEYMCVSAFDDVEYATVEEILLARGLTEEVEKIQREAIEAGIDFEFGYQLQSCTQEEINKYVEEKQNEIRKFPSENKLTDENRLWHEKLIERLEKFKR
jgi:hypothetical protein